MRLICSNALFFFIFERYLRKINLFERAFRKNAFFKYLPTDFTKQLLIAITVNQVKDELEGQIELKGRNNSKQTLSFPF